MRLIRDTIAVCVRNPVLANLIIVCSLAAAYLTIRHIPREAYPEFFLDIVSMDVAYPGASAEDVERSICVPIEAALAGIEGIYELTSQARANMATIGFIVREDVEDVSRIVEETKARVEQITTLPPEAEEPVILARTFRPEVISVALYGDVGERTLKAFAKEVRDDLRAMGAISQVSMSGAREEEIIIELSETSLRRYDLTFDQIIASIARSSLDLPAGQLRTAGEEVALRVTGQRFTAHDYEDLVVIERPDALVRLKDVATVREGFEDVTKLGRFNGEPAVLVNVYKTPREDTTEIAALVRDYVADKKASIPEGVSIAHWGDNSVQVDGRLGMLLVNAVSGIVLVFLVLWLFVEVRLAFWVTVGIPVSFAGAIIVLGWQGGTLNLISMFALIMVSGMIVDDAIVIAESIHTRRRAGDAPELAAIEGASIVALPVLASSITTIIAFVPLLFVAGVMGKLIHVLPVVVIAAIVSSAIEGFGVLPAHLNRHAVVGQRSGPKPPNRLRRRIDGAIDAVITQWYRPVYRLALRFRAVTIAIVLALTMILGGMVLSGRTAFVLLPEEDGQVLRARVRFPDGTPLTTTEAAVARIEAAALALNDDPALEPAKAGDLVEQVYSVTGEHADFLVSTGNNLCEVRIELMAAEDRRISDEQIMTAWRARVGPIDDAVTFTVGRLLPGPIESPVEVRLLGDDLEVLTAAADEVEQQLTTYQGVSEAFRDLVPGQRELHIDLKPQARALGLTLADVATQLRQGFFGGEAVRVYRGSEEVVVRVRYPQEERRSIAELESKRFRTVRGDEIPFSEAVDVEWRRGWAEILHQDGHRRVRVFANLDERTANAEQIIQDMERTFLPALAMKFPGLRYHFGGNRQAMERSLSTLFDGYKVTLLAIYAVLAGMLRSYFQPIVILATVPLGMIGAIMGHMILGYDVTLMSMFGFVALSGVIVNDALVLVDQINRSIGDGESVFDSVLMAGEARFRAVMLTTITTVAGLTPLLAERSTQAYAVKPMAISLVFGEIFGTVLTLIVVPVFFLVVNDARRVAYWLRYGGAYPRREIVEEAARERLLGTG